MFSCPFFLLKPKRTLGIHWWKMCNFLYKKLQISADVMGFSFFSKKNVYISLSIFYMEDNK